MDKKLNNIVSKCSVHFNDWITIIDEHRRILSHPNEVSEEKYIERTYNLSDVLGQFSNMHLKYGAFKDKFDNSKMYLRHLGPELIIESEKTNNIFYLGVDLNGIYLRTHIKYSKNLRHMGDDFYGSIFTLMDLGEFDIQQHQFYSYSTESKYDKLFNNHKSKIFKLLRNYIVGIAEDESDILLGDFYIHWGYHKYIEEILSNSCIAFKIFYKLNYALWKINDLDKKKQKEFNSSL